MWIVRYWKRWLVTVILVLVTGHLWRTLRIKTKTPKTGVKGAPPLTSVLSKWWDRNSTVTSRRQTRPVMLWWDSVYTSVDENRTCGKHQCRVTNNRSLKDNPDTKMFIFYGSHFKPYNLPVPRRSDQLWALIHEESPRNSYILSHEPALSIFNFTSSYNQNSNYPITTQWLQCPDWLQDTQYVLPLVDKNRLRRSGLAPILYLQSDCDVPSDRDVFVQELQKFIPVDSYGPCVNNQKMPDRIRFHDTMEPLDDADFFRFAARYKFTLAMENYVCDDYITEKLWRPLRLGSVPIVFGAPNVKDYLPSNRSAIIVEDFPDIEDLANYIDMLDRNNKLYKQFLTFKDNPIQNVKLKHLLQSRDWQPEFCFEKKHKSQELFRMEHKELRPYDSIFTGFECYLCDKLHEIGMGDSSYLTDASHFRCPSPRRFDDHGRYSIHSDTWSAEWNYGKFEAAAMMQIYQLQKMTSKKEFDILAHSIMAEDV